MTRKIALVYENSSAKGWAADSVFGRHAATMHSCEVSPDRDVLMQLLSTCLPLVEAATATSALLDSYEDYAGVVAAPFNDLRDIACVGEHGVRLLKCVYTAAIHLAAAPLQRITTVSDWPSLFAYLNTSLAREKMR